jgi:hypothetical protein
VVAFFFAFFGGFTEIASAGAAIAVLKKILM